jgi:HemY protein
MLWSLSKLLIFVAIVTVLTFGVGYLSELSGGAVLRIADLELTFSPLELTVALVALIVLIWAILQVIGLILAFVSFVNGDETAISRFFSRNRERRGVDALSDSLVALAAGEGQVAIAKAQKAERLLNRPELTNLLIAQGAEAAGDTKKAEESYKALLADDRTRFVAVRGLMQQRLAAGDTATALKLAEKAFQLKPRHLDTQDVLLRLQTESGDWAGARGTLSAKLKTGTLPKDVYKRRDAILALSEAKAVFSDDSSIEAREAAIEANRLSPDLIPAAAMAARGYIAAANPRYATRVIKKAWEVQPHPDLAAVFAEIEPNESAEARLTRFEALTRTNPDHPETRMLLAELLIAAERFPAAERALQGLTDGAAATGRSLTLMAAIARGQGQDDAVVRGWLTRAVTAPRGPQWVCDKCQNVHANWTPVCQTCHAFDTLSWRQPPASELTLPGGAEMLPLIVGKPASGPEEGALIVPEDRP